VRTSCLSPKELHDVISFIIQKVSHDRTETFNTKVVAPDSYSADTFFLSLLGDLMYKVSRSV